MSIVTVDQLVAALGREIAEDDPVALSACQRASSLIEAELPEFSFQAAEGIVIPLEGNWTHKIQLPRRPVARVSAVAVGVVTPEDGFASWESVVEEYVLPAQSWRWNYRRTIERVDGGTFGGTDASVWILADYEASTIPAAVSTVALQLAVRFFSNPEGIRQETLGGYSVLYGGSDGAALTGDERRILRQYRRRSWG